MGIDLGKQSGKINLGKDEQVVIERTELITVTVSWPSQTDYDVFALVQYRDGHVETVAQFGTTDNRYGYKAVTADKAVRHLGDVRAPGPRDIANEQIEIRMTPDIKQVVPVAYSAQGNGAGSFRKYQVSMSIDNGAGTRVEVPSKKASRNPLVYSCVPGLIRNTSDGVQIVHRELYSKMNSERRPAIAADGSVVMDAGPTNVYKN